MLGEALKHRVSPMTLAEKDTGLSLKGLSIRIGATHGRPPNSADSSGMPRASAGSALSCSLYLKSPSCRGHEWLSDRS